MVNTLRITSVVAILVAGVVLVLVIGPKSLVPKLLAKFAMGSDEEVARILDAPGVVDQFVENQGSRNQDRQEATSPLVKQAEVFAGIINPPEPVGTSLRPKPPGRTPGRTTVTPVPTSAKFNLVGTAYAASDPDGSFAYIRLADNTYQWVRRGEEVGHLVVKEIRDRSIIYSEDGHSDVEMSVEPAPETANLLEASGAATAPAKAEKVPVRPGSGRITGPPAARRWTPSRATPRPNTNINAEERDKLEELANRIKESKAAGAAGSPEERAAMMKLMSDFKSSRVSDEEAEDVEDLGRELNESQKMPASPKRTNLRRKLNIPRSPSR